ncbi:hypothetical protein [Anaerosphaera multitolerans]|uniref:Uncharacterized protein n=1 Tax=Anaerosphaera multitolerans TaxID=2487351 RepID=A0A437S7Z3_9FIRM|nr:hypothetical protein [Anaerosphaera multitolerans]RVU55028.1 hypothetical protein EF514_03825 [Anaerosphaera multitolerans]
MRDLYQAIIKMLKNTAPISIAINVILGLALLIVGLYLFKSQRVNPRIYKACFLFSGLFLISSMTTGLARFLIS